MSDSSSISQLLNRYADGDQKAYDQLLPIVYDRLRAIARSNLRGARRNHSLQATELVHEAMLLLGKRDDLDFRCRAHFYRAIAQCMRWILKDHAKAQASQKRGGECIRVAFEEQNHAAEGSLWDLCALNAALEALSVDFPRVTKVLELRFLVGLNFEEIAEVLEISVITVKRDWTFAKAWLSKRLASHEEKQAA
jgi:RNA polymerase sigma factor (TIGR02999 family)